MLVILLLALALTLFAGTKKDRDRVDLAQQALVETGVDARGNATISVVDGGTTTVYSGAEGWTLEQRGDRRFVQRETDVNKFLNFENIVQVLVYTSFIAIMAVGITAVISTGGIDLSVGSTYALAALVGALVLRYNWSEGMPPVSIQGSALAWWLAAGAGIACVAARVFARWKGGSASRMGGARAVDVVTRVVMFVGVTLLLVAGWRLLRALHEGWEIGDRSTLPLAAALPLALAVCCLVGAGAGWLNGVMIVGLRVHPFIITLGTMAAYRGLVAIPTSAQSVGNFPASYQGFVKMELMGVNPVPVLFMLLVALGGVFVLSKTVLGRHVYAIGGNETAATYAGIPVGRVKVLVYTIMGALAGLSAAMYLGYFGATETNAGAGYELKVIAAAVIGGASLAGGRGSALGAVLGAVLVQLIDNAMIILRIDQNYNQIVMGAAIVAAVVLDQVKARLVPRGR